MKNLRVAAVTCCAPVGRTAENLDRLQTWVSKAVREKADLVCFPELGLTGYTTQSALLSAAQPLPGPLSRAISTLSTRQNIIILAGLAERDEKEEVFASHLAVFPGKTPECYRKLHIAPPEKSILKAGNEIPVFRSGEIFFGIQLCYDAHFPELSTRMALDGAEILFFPHASPFGRPEDKFHSWMRHLPARAYDNGVFVIACNQRGENGYGLDFPGLVVGIDPSGKLLEKDLSGQEGMLVFELKKESLSRVRDHRMRYFLPHRRAELYLP